MAKRKKRRKQRKNPRKLSRKQRDDAKAAMLRVMIREATRTGATEAIEHCHNFWQVGDGFKKYIEAQIKSEAQALLDAVTIALRKELAELSKQFKRRKRHKP